MSLSNSGKNQQKGYLLIDLALQFGVHDRDATQQTDQPPVNAKTLYGQCAMGLLDRINFTEFDTTAFKNLHV